MKKCKLFNNFNVQNYKILKIKKMSGYNKCKHSDQELKCFTEQQ